MTDRQNIHTLLRDKFHRSFIYLQGKSSFNLIYWSAAIWLGVYYMLDAQLFLPPRSVQLREYCNHEYHDKLPETEGRKERTNRTKKKTLFSTKIVHIQTSAHESLTVIGLSRVMVMMEGLIGRTLPTVR
jgi:hypothetical protein